jgi:hypothetical protein
MSGERKGLPSASSMERYMLCPGSYAAEQGQPDETSEDAESGNRIHAALAGETVTPPLTDDEERTMEACRSQADALLDAIIPHRDEIILERRYWWGEQWSGKPDVVAIDTLQAHALVLDYKTGRGEVASAEGNMQLRALAVLVALEHPLEKVTVAIVQPLAGEASTCSYDARHLKQARHQICSIIDAIHQPDATRRPSAKACKYCKAKAACPEAREASVVLPLANIPEGATASAIAATLTGETLAEFLRRAEFATKVIDACRDEAKRRLEEGEVVPGWTLKPGSVRESITEPATVFGRFVAAGGTQEQFMPCVLVTKTKLKDAVKAVTSAKGRVLDAQIETMLDGCTEAKASAPSLVKLSA